MNFASLLQIIFSLLSYQNASNTSVIMPYYYIFQSQAEKFNIRLIKYISLFRNFERGRYKVSFYYCKLKGCYKLSTFLFVTGLSEWERCIFLVNHTSSLYHESKNSPSCARLSKYRCVCHVLAIFERLFLNAFINE